MKHFYGFSVQMGFTVLGYALLSDILKRDCNINTPFSQLGQNFCCYEFTNQKLKQLSAAVAPLPLFYALLNFSVFIQLGNDC